MKLQRSEVVGAIHESPAKICTIKRWSTIRVGVGVSTTRERSDFAQSNGGTQIRRGGVRVSSGDLCIRKYAEAPTEPAGETFHARPSNLANLRKRNGDAQPVGGDDSAPRVRLDFAQTQRRCAPADGRVTATPLPFCRFATFSLTGKSSSVPTRALSQRKTRTAARAVPTICKTTCRSRRGDSRIARARPDFHANLRRTWKSATTRVPNSLCAV